VSKASSTKRSILGWLNIRAFGVVAWNWTLYR
jgi:hypothetical protein